MSGTNRPHRICTEFEEGVNEVTVPLCRVSMPKLGLYQGGDSASFTCTPAFRTQFQGPQRRS